MENNVKVVDCVDALIEKIAVVREAQRKFSTYSEEQVDKIFLAAATAANKMRIPLARMAVEETGMGIVEDKVIKNHYASEYIYNAYRNVKTCGVIEEDKAYGIKKIAEPVGLIAAVIPTTNPTSTAIFKTLISLKTRNGIIISPHPRAKKSTIAAAKVVLDAAVKAGAPEDIIGWIVVDGTLIDYPILYDTTYNYYYLNHNYEGTSTGYGSIFVLGENAGDFTDFNTVVYGHNMLDGRMFAQLHRFRDKNFFDSHGQIIVYTPERQLTYQVFAAYRRDNLDIIANTDFSTKALIDEYIESVYAQTDLAQFNPALEVTSSDRIITLSTCIGNPAYRFVVQGVLVDEAQAVFAGTPDADGE